MRVKQAEMDLGDAQTLEKRAYLTLAMLIGKKDVSLDAGGLFNLSTESGGNVPEVFSGTLDEQKLIGLALTRRPETRGSAIALETGEHSARLAAAPLYPTVTFTGNYTLADPNQRVAFQTDPWLFTGTWSLGVVVTYDLGGLPANLAEIRAQANGLSKIQADAEGQQNSWTCGPASSTLSAPGGTCRSWVAWSPWKK